MAVCLFYDVANSFKFLSAAMQTRYLFLLRFILPAVDLTMINIVYTLSYVFTIYMGKSINYEGQMHYLVVCNLLWLISSFLFRLYSEHSTWQLEHIYRATWKTALMHSILFTLYLFFSGDREFPRTFIAVFYLLLVLACGLNRFFGTLLQYILVKRFKIGKSVAIMGNNYTAARLKQYLKKQKNIHFYGFIGTHDGNFSNLNGSLHVDTIKQITLAVQAGVKDLYVCISPEKMLDVTSLLYEADRQLLRLKFVPDINGFLNARYTSSYLGGEFPILTIRDEPLEDISNRFKKRAFDVIFSFFVIILVLSWLHPIIALLIKIESRGPVLFKQKRSGRNDISFYCYKFRSMKVNVNSESKQATKYDDRVTNIGQFLRKTSLDELPQFYNVFQGYMSVVGPRPHMLKHTEEYRKLIDKFMVRHYSKPGITGWAQVNGFRGETRETSDMVSRVEYDIHYIENWSLMWDVRIIFLTIINVVRGEDNAF